MRASLLGMPAERSVKLEIPYDALLVLSFGGPEGMDDVMPFLANVLRGRNVPAGRLQEVAHHYELFGGVSPINEQNRLLIAAVRAELAREGPELPVYWGNRNWHPLLADTLGRMAEDGIKRALAFVTSAYSSYSGCRQYLEDIDRARAAVGAGAPEVEKLRAFFNHPGFLEPNIENLRLALDLIPAERRQSARLTFTAHSIPKAMAATCRYEEELTETCRLLSEGAGNRRWQLVYQSRSGPPSQPWLEPDLGDHIRQLALAGVVDLVVAPVGFISDHMEVIYDLDTEARQLCRELDINMVRAATVGTHPRFVSMIRELVVERVEGRECVHSGLLSPAPHVCPTTCCAYSPGRPPARADER